MKTLIVLVIVLFTLMACQQSEAEKEYSKNIWQRNQQSVDACIKAGGIPIYSIWDGRLKDCKFPPNKEGEK